MQTSKHPSKEQVRAWLRERRIHPAPLPDLALIRLQLGWSNSPADITTPASAHTNRGVS
ncbi:hypothetical protein [Pseudoduganella namucuonensis]|uniref:Uncharacterized protein n=1 Tax=Pseudoduganella namucuonensis TaxID=1035707 RepID=A0A1I7LSP9_9BURK|nr:hypothetical protein [Pseudoduganella namucuonensis]SFV12672.1 hypothetical protein SAMN05216552_103683 [Pseudoduganella namucuonensis]